MSFEVFCFVVFFNTSFIISLYIISNCYSKWTFSLIFKNPNLAIFKMHTMKVISKDFIKVTVYEIYHRVEAPTVFHTESDGIDHKWFLRLRLKT